MNILTSPIAEKFPWPESSSIKQDFSFPSSVIYYIARNPPNPNLYLKMIRSCKYFYEKMPLLIICRISKGKILCSNNEKECYENDRKCCVKTDIAKLKSKIWLTNKLCRFSNNIIFKKFAPIFRQKIYRCENAELVLYRNKIDFDDFQLLAIYFKKIDLMDVNITDKDGKTVLLENIIAAIPNVEKFEYFFDTHITVATASTLNNISKIKNFATLKLLELWNIPEIFNVEDISSFIQNNHKSLKIAFDFNSHLTEEYKDQLDQLIDIILQNKIPDCIITYPGQNKQKLTILESGCSF